jgi:hypothetical protein
MANLQISNPDQHAALQHELATLTRKGDQVMLTQHGENSTQVRAERANQELGNIGAIEQWGHHSGVTSQVESLGLQARTSILSTLENHLSPELRLQLEEALTKIDAGLNPTDENRKKTRNQIKKMSVKEYQAKLKKTIDDGLKQISNTTSLLEAESSKARTEAQRAKARRQKKNRKARDQEKKSAVIFLQRLFRKNPNKFKNALIQSTTY